MRKLHKAVALRTKRLPSISCDYVIYRSARSFTRNYEIIKNTIVTFPRISKEKTRRTETVGYKDVRWLCLLDVVWSAVVIAKKWRKWECQVERCRKRVNSRIKLRVVFIRRACKNRRSNLNTVTIDFVFRTNDDWTTDVTIDATIDAIMTFMQSLIISNNDYFIINGSETLS